MRRYQMKYHVVGGFSFYERAEIKDLISYLKVIHNPDDSIAMQRVINTPPRGIGKNTMETLERIALETGVSLWRAIGETIRRELLPPRALAALKSFQGADRRCAGHASGNVSRARGRDGCGASRAASATERREEDDCSTAMDFSPEMFAETKTRPDFAPEASRCRSRRAMPTSSARSRRRTSASKAFARRAMRRRPPSC